MNCASHPDVDERADLPSAATMRAYRSSTKPKPIIRYIPPANKPPEWNLKYVTEQGAYWCARCYKYQPASDGATCKHCERPVKWQPPIFSDAKESQAPKILAA